MHRSELLALLARYRTPFLEEAAMVDRTRRFVAEQADCFERALTIGHVSGSSWVVNPRRDHVLMMHHRKLDMWLQPGGHADGDHDPLRVAVKETAEEAGVAPEHVRVLSPEVFDVDVHAIPATAREPRHIHYDIRFLLELDDRLVLPGNPDEAHAVAWIPLNDVPRFNNMRSVYRLVRKTRNLGLPLP